MHNVLRNLLHVSIACALLSSTPSYLQSTQAKQLSCSQTNCIYIPVVHVHITPYLTVGNWYFIQYSVKVDTITQIYGEIENNSGFPLENILINYQPTQFSTQSKFVLAGKQAPFRIEIHGLYPYDPLVKPIVLTWTVNSTAKIQLLDVLMITSQEQRDEIGLGYTTVTVTMQNGTPNILHDVDVQVWSYHLFDENTCITCSQSYTRTTLLPQEFYTVTARWNITGYFPRSEVKVAAYGVISP